MLENMAECEMYCAEYDQAERLMTAMCATTKPRLRIQAFSSPVGAEHIEIEASLVSKSAVSSSGH